VGGGDGVRTEYRLVWKRAASTDPDGGAGQPFRKVRRFQTLAAAKRHIVRLTGPDVDPHYRCDHDTGFCEPCPPIIDGPHLEQRWVGGWERPS
jgi:hypothetical protein